MMIKKRSREEIEIIFDFLKMDFEEKIKPKSNLLIGRDLLSMILWRERVRHGVENSPELFRSLDLKTLNKMRLWDTEKYELFAPMLALKKMATGELRSAIRILKNTVEEKINEISRLQTAKSTKPRPKRKHQLTILVEEIYKTNSDLNKGKLDALLRQKIRGTKNPTVQIDTQKQLYIPTDPKFEPVPVSRLSKYLYRAKKKNYL